MCAHHRQQQPFPGPQLASERGGHVSLPEMSCSSGGGPGLLGSSLVAVSEAVHVAVDKLCS